MRRQNERKLRALVPSFLAWFAQHARDLPWRRSRDPYAIWVSEIMLQQTQVKTMIPYWERWMRALPTIPSAAQASPAKLHKLWEGLGYYTRVRNLQRAAQVIVFEHGGEFPDNFDDVLALPGIGRYTAGAICSMAFNQPRPILDGNVIRVLTRLFGIRDNPREKKTNARLWHLANELVLHASRLVASKRSGDGSPHPASSCSYLNQSLMELGALVCTPRSPQCNACPVNKLCVARKQNLQEQLPNLGKRKVSAGRRFIAFVVERGGKFLVRQRPDGVVNAHLWEFPNVEVPAAPPPRRRVSRSKQPVGETPALPGCNVRLASTQPFCVIKHSITRYRITLEAYRAELANSRTGAPSTVSARFNDGFRLELSRRAALHGQWLTRRQLRQRAFTSAHKKILARIGTPSTASSRHRK